MKLQIKRHIGRILLDGGFLRNSELDRGLEEQKHTKELLGQVLVRMGVLKERDFKVPLIVQKHISHIDDAVKIAAGERQLLGVLLVRSGHITNDQLDHAIAEQKVSGEKLGEVFMRLGMMTNLQLTSLLDFQKNQCAATSGPLKLGELLVATGHISRKQLDDVLRKQALTHKKIGEVLVEEGYVRPSIVKYGICLQKMLVGSVLASIMSLGMGSTGFASSFVMQWDPVVESDIAGYKVYYSPDSSPLEGSVPVDVQKETAATVDGLDAGKSYNFAVTAYNTAGAESAFSNIVFAPEQTPPTVAITSPADLISVSGTVSISVNATDNVGVTKVEFYVNGVLKATDIGAPYVYSWDTSSLAVGAYTLMAKAYDAAGNVAQSATSTVNIVKDVIPPAVAVTSPVNNAIISGTVPISSSATDNVGVSKVEFYANDVFLYASNVSPYSYSWDTKSVVNGAYNITAKAYDSSNNVAQSAVVTVNVNNIGADTIAPTVSIASPVANSTVNGDVYVAASVSDNVGVTKVEYYVNGGLDNTLTVAPFNYTVPTTVAHNGSYTMYAKAYDAAGNVKQSPTISFTIYNSAADTIAPTAVITSPTAGATVSGTVAIAASASDNVGVNKVEFYVNGALKGTDTSSPYSYSWDSKSVVNGTYAISTKAYDAAGNVTQSPSVNVSVNNVVVDTIAPTTAITSPAAGATVSGTVAIAASASDNVGVNKIEFYVNGALQGTDTSSPYSYSWDSKSVANGTYAITTKAYDAAGNVTQSPAVNVTVKNVVVDTTAPTVSIAYPLANSIVSGVVQVAASVSDNVGVTKVEYYVNGGLDNTLTAAPFSYSVPTTVAQNGTYSMYAKAYDAAGNVKQSSTISFTIKNK